MLKETWNKTEIRRHQQKIKTGKSACVQLWYYNTDATNTWVSESKSSFGSIFKTTSIAAFKRQEWSY